MPEEDNKSHNTFLYILLFSCLIVIISSFYFLYYKKNYQFLVETQCNKDTETCFYRDCSIEGDCPPNNFSYYSKYNLKASDFKSCLNEDCTLACKENLISCKKIECTEDDINSGVCLVPEPIVDPIIPEISKSKK